MIDRRRRCREDHYSKSIKQTWILANHDKMPLQDKGHDSENYSFRVISF